MKISKKQMGFTITEKEVKDVHGQKTIHKTLHPNFIEHTHPNRKRRRRMDVLTKKEGIRYEYDGEKNEPYSRY